MKKTSLIWKILFPVWLFFYPDYCDAQRLFWKDFGNLLEARHAFCALPLSNHEVLVMGGWGESAAPLSGDILYSCEIIDLQSQKIYSAEPMTTARTEFVALLTKDSNIVVVSGYNTPTVEIFERKSRTWKMLGSLLVGRKRHSAEFISDTEILIVGGVDKSNISLESAEIFDIRTGFSRSVADFPQKINLACAGISSEGKTIFAGGRSGGMNSSANEAVFSFNSAKNSWEKLSSLGSGVASAEITKLWDKRLVITGGSLFDGTVKAQSVCSVERNSTFFPTESLHIPRLGHSNAQWSPDTLAIIGGFDYSAPNSAFSYAEFLTISRSTVEKAPTLNLGRRYFRAISLPHRDSNGDFLSGRILAISGFAENGQNTPNVEILEWCECDKNLPSSSVQLFTRNDTAVVGTTFRIPVFAELLTPSLPFSAEVLEFDMEFDARRFYPNFFDGGTIVRSQRDNSGKQVLTIQVGASVITSANIKIGDLVGTVLMSKIAENEIVISRQSWLSFQKNCLETSQKSSFLSVKSCFLFDLEPMSSYYLYLTPNPAETNARLTILNAPQGIYKAEISSVAGATMWSESWNVSESIAVFEKNFDVRNFADGVYMLRIFSPNGMHSAQFVVNK